MTAAITLARQYLANLPQSPADGHEAIAHLSGVLAALDEQKPAGHVVTWNKGGSGEYNSIEPIGKLGYSLAASLPDGALIYLAPPASSNLLTAARHYASSYLQQERDEPKLCCDEQHHEDVCALFAAIEGEGESGPDDARDGPRYRALIEAAHAYITGKPMTPQQMAVHDAIKMLGVKTGTAALDHAIDAAIAATKEDV